jgi:hypothetical protein
MVRDLWVDFHRLDADGLTHGHIDDLAERREAGESRASVHPPYGADVIDDLTPEDAEAFIEAVLS